MVAWTVEKTNKRKRHVTENVLDQTRESYMLQESEPTGKSGTEKQGSTQRTPSSKHTNRRARRQTSSEGQNTRHDHAKGTQEVIPNRKQGRGRHWSHTSLSGCGYSCFRSSSLSVLLLLSLSFRLHLLYHSYVSRKRVGNRQLKAVVPIRRKDSFRENAL